MKKLLFLATILLFAACGSDTPAADNKAEAGELIKTIVPRIEGVWVMTDYIAKMEETNSPKAASDLLNGAVVIDINKASMRTDSMEGGVNWNNHEGSGFTIYFKKGIAEGSLKTSLTDEEGFFDIGSVDSSLVLYHYDGANRLIDKRQFTKVLRKQLNPDLGFGIQYAVNRKIFKGKYVLHNSVTNDTASIEFTMDGKVKGFEDYKYYLAATDFMDEYSNMDYITFYKDEKNNEAFGYTKSAGLISLYTLLKDEKAGTISYGKLRYTIREKH